MAAPEKDILLRISQVTSSISDLERLLKTSVKIAGQGMGVDRCSVWLADDKKKHATVRAVYTKGRFRPTHLEARIEINRFPGFKRIISDGKVIHSPDISKLAASRFEKRFLSETKIKSFLCLPLKIKNRVLGALNFGTLRKHKTFTPAEIRLCRTIANQITIGIENARLRKELEDRAVQLQEQGVKVLKESEQKYRTLLENLPQLIFLKNKRSVYVSVNKNFCKSLGVKPEQIIGKTDFSFFPRELAQKYRKDDRDILKTGKTKEIVEDYIEKGKRRIVQTVKTPVLGDDGKPIGILGIFWDITERRRTEEMVKESEKKYRTLVETAQEGIGITDPDENITFANRAFADLLGYRKEKLLGVNLKEISYKEDFAKFRKETRKRKKGQSSRYETKLYTRTGKLKYFSMAATPIYDVKGAFAGTMGLLSDITERKRLERALIQKELTARERARLLTDLRGLNEFDDILTRVCEAVRNSGLFERAVMTFNRPGGEIMDLGQVGLPAAVVQRARKAPPLDPKLRTRITSKRFRVSDSFFVPAEAGVDFRKTGRYIPQKTKESVDGDWQSGDELFAPLRDFSGKTMGYLSVDTPVDGRRPDKKTIQALEMLVEAAASRIREVEAQKALKRERDFSQSIVETANSLIVCLDADAKIMVFNQECERVTGYQREEVIGKRWPKLFLPPDHHRNKLKSFAKWVRAHPRDQYEGPIKTKKGEFRTILWSNTAIFGPAREDIIAIAIGQDISERKRAEHALRESEEKFRTLAEHSPNMIFINKKGKVVYANKKCEEVLGYGREEFYSPGFDYLTLIAPEYVDMVKEKFKKHIKGQDVAPYEYAILSKKGERIEVIGSTKLITYEGENAILGIITDITERKNAEEELKKSEERFRVMAETSPDYIFQTNIQGTTIYCSPAIEPLLGYIPEERQGKNFTSVILPSDLPKAKALFKKVTEGEIIQNVEINLLHKSGRTVPIEVSVVPTFKNKEVIGLFGIARDITERKKADEALKESEEKFRNLFENANDAIFLANPKTGIIIDANKQAERLLDRPREEIIGLRQSKLHPPDKEKYYKEMFRRHGEKGGSVNFEAEVIRKDGAVVPVYISAGVIKIAGEKVLQGIFRDITELKKADEALKESQKFLEEIIDHIPDPVFIKNRKHQWILLNKAITEMVGYSREEMLGKSDHDFFPKKQADFFWKKDEEMFRTGKVVDIPEEPISDAQGNIHWLHTKKAPLKDSSGKINTLVGIIRDITDQKKAVEALRKSRDLNTILQISYKITQIHDLDEMLKLACEETAKALGVERCTVSLMDEERKGVEVKAAYMKNQPRPEIIGSKFLLKDFPRLLRLYQRKEKFIYAPIVEKAPLSQRERDYFRAEGVKSFVIVPIATGERLSGVIMVGAMGRERVFAESEIAFVQTLANHLAVAVENVRLMDVVKEQAENVEILSQRVISAQEEERKRTAQQLHDEIGQDLAYMKINTEITRKHVPAELDQVIQRIKDNENLIIQTLNKVRDLTSYLRPPLLDDLGVVETLRWYVKDFSRRTNVKVILKSDKYRCRLSQDLEMVLYRIAQEALANVAKHAQAAQVSVTLERKNNHAFLTVKDDGIGFELEKMKKEQKARKGFGLFDIEERVKLLNGNFSIKSEPKKGTRLQVKIPCPGGR